MQTTIATAEQRVTTPRLVLSMAATPEEVREVQRLRYKVFIENQGLSALATADGLDCDEFDAARGNLRGVFRFSANLSKMPISSGRTNTEAAAVGRTSGTR